MTPFQLIRRELAERALPQTIPSEALDRMAAYVVTIASPELDAAAHGGVPEPRPPSYHQADAINRAAEALEKIAARLDSWDSRTGTTKLDVRQKDG